MKRVRRPVAVGSAALVAGLLLVGLTQSTAAAAPGRTGHSGWTQSDGGASHSRTNSAQTTINQGTVADLLPGAAVVAPSSPHPANCSFYGAQHPTLVGDSLYGIFGGRISAYRGVSSGSLLWRGPSDAHHLTDYTSVSVADGLVVAGSESCDSVSDPSGAVTALDAATGALRWRTPAQMGVFDTVVSGNTVIAKEFGNGAYTAAEAFDLTTGKQLWVHDYTFCTSARQALVVRGLSIASGCNLNSGQPALVASNLRTGKTVWTRSGSWNPQAGDTDAADGRHLYAVDGSGTVQDLDPSTGATQHSLTGATSVLAVAGVRVFTTCSAGICAFRETSGAPSWTAASTATLAAASVGVLYLSDGQVLNAYNGQLLSEVFTGTATELAVGSGTVALVLSSAPRTLAMYSLVTA